MSHTRRAVLVSALGSLGALAGCVEGSGGDGAAPARTDTGSPVPTAERSLYVPHERARLTEAVRSGGPPKDGIPSIDDPQFASAGATDLDDGEPVFGLVRDGVARAYPQYVLAHHEIVNDEVAGDGVAVTYCPLTGTAQGFERGDVEFGVSGNLLNSNLVMYDRRGDSRWPQVLATAISGPMAGATLREFRLVWTTWGRWRAAHPDTEIMTEETGYARRYGSDPYGDYNPPRGYYANDRTLFPPLVEDDRASPKTVVVGARTASGAAAFDKQALLDAGVLTATAGETPLVAVADPALRTAYVYADPDGRDVRSVDGGYRLDGERHEAATLPLERVLAFDAMWFAWAGYYPESPYVT